MQFINLFYGLILFSLPITGMDRKRTGDQAEQKPKKSHRADPEGAAELRILQNICALHSYFSGMTPTKNSSHGQ